MSLQEATRRQRQRLLSNHLSEQEFADEINKSIRAIRAWRQQGLGPPWIRIGKSVFYEVSAIENWLASLRRKPARNRVT
jgi:hypothetical protein